MATKKHYKRAFLNPKHGVACIESKFEMHDGQFNCDGNLKITDCNHTVNLEFGWYDQKGKTASKQKLETLIQNLVSTQKFLFPEDNNATKES